MIISSAYNTHICIWCSKAIPFHLFLENIWRCLKMLNPLSTGAEGKQKRRPTSTLLLLIPFKKLSFLWAQWKTPDFPKKLGVQRSNPVAIKNLGSHLLFRESPSGDSSLSPLRGQPRSVALRWRWQCAASPQTCDTATRRRNAGLM